MARLFLTALALAIVLVFPARSASLSKEYTYFMIGGRTMGEIEKELSRHGPKLASTGKRHAGATRMEFTTRLDYGERNGRCAIVGAKVSVKATVILPRWRGRGADGDVRLVWEALSADIKRHEESHVAIARNHARVLENSLKAIKPERTCDATAASAKKLNDRIMARHDEAQDEFDRTEGDNFQPRMRQLIDHRMKQAAVGR